MLWKGTAGYWPNTGGNADLVPTVANGRVYVASNQQLQIFGLRPLKFRFPPRITGEVTEGELQAKMKAQPPSGPQFWGTVKSVEGNTMVLVLRTGKELRVDISAAVKLGHVALVQNGQPALVKGEMGTDGVFNATVVQRAKGRSIWGEDREK